MFHGPCNYCHGYCNGTCKGHAHIPDQYPLPPSRRTTEFDQVLLQFLQAIFNAVQGGETIDSQTLITNLASSPVPFYLVGGDLSGNTGNAIITRTIPVTLVSGQALSIQHNLGPQALIDHVYFYRSGAGSVFNVAVADLREFVTSNDGNTLSLTPSGITGAGFIAVASHINA